MKNDRQFIGRAALENKPRYNMIGLELLDKGVLRGHQKIVLDDQVIGEITSGTFSPTLQKSIALARISADVELELGATVYVQIRQKKLQAKRVKYPFI